jgi:hypothetical protein
MTALNSPYRKLLGGKSTQCSFAKLAVAALCIMCAVAELAAMSV